MTTSLRPNEENEAVGAIRGKGLTVAGDKGRVTRGRTALTEISNRPAAIQNKGKLFDGPYLEISLTSFYLLSFEAFSRPRQTKGHHSAESSPGYPSFCGKK